jgi:hypothetical protein
MTLIDLGDFKLRFDPKEIRINIDGEMIDIGAKREWIEEKYTPNGKGGYDLGINIKSDEEDVTQKVLDWLDNHPGCSILSLSEEIRGKIDINKLMEKISNQKSPE